MHLCMIIWYYRIPCGYRRQMQQRDVDYRNQLKSYTRSNSYQQKMNNKTKFSLLNVIIKDDIRDRIARL
jgi:hypothetical protein